MSAETATPQMEAATVVSPVRPASTSSAAARAGELYERYHDRIYGYCLFKLGNREEAEDAAQTTFLLALRGLERGIVPRMEANWLFTIAQNACRCRARSRGRGREREVLSDPHVLQEVAPGRTAADDELVGLDAALKDMPDLQRRALILREWRGCSYREIAEELGLTGAAVETLIFRARRSLAQRLEHQPLVTKRRAGAFALDFGSLASGLKSALGIGSGAKLGVAASTLAAVAIGLSVPGDSPRPDLLPVTSRADPASLAEPRLDHGPLPAKPVKAAKPQARPGQAPPGGTAGAEVPGTNGLDTTLEGTLGQVTSSLPTAVLTDSLLQQVGETVGGALQPAGQAPAPNVFLP